MGGKPYYKKMLWDNKKCWQGYVEKLELSYIIGGNVKWYSHFGKQFGVPSKS